MRELLYRSVIIPAFERLLHGRDIFRHWRDLERTQWLPRAELARRQLTALRSLLRHARLHSPYYASEWANRGLDPDSVQTLDDFTSWPITDRETIRAHRQAMRCAGAGISLLSKTTSGSSGTPLQFDFNPESHDRRVAASYRGYAWAGAGPGTLQLYLWGATPGQQSCWKRWKETLYHRIHRRVILNTFDLSDQMVDSFVRRINLCQPDVIVAYTGSLYALTRMLAERRIRPFAPKSIIAAAEKLHPFQRELIEEVFQAPVFETYGCREFMLVAAECERQQGLHLTMENLLVELLDDDGNRVPEGQEGNVVITDLFNYGMPFIRYANGDRAVADPTPCPCGRGLPVLRQVVGRRLDVLHTPDGRRLPGEFFPLLLKDFPGIKQFQVIQEAPDRIRLCVVLDASWTETDRRELLADIIPALGPAVKFELTPMDNIPLTRAGKLQVVVNRCGAPSPVTEPCVTSAGSEA